MRTITLELSIAKAKQEVLGLIREGHVEADEVTGFGDLHSVTDANVLGYLCDGDVSLGAERVQFEDEQGVIPHDGTDAANDRWMAFGNVMQDAVHDWIVSGGHRSALQPA